MVKAMPTTLMNTRLGKEAVSDALALKAAHGQLCSVTYEVTGDIPSDAGASSGRCQG